MKDYFKENAKYDKFVFISKEKEDEVEKLDPCVKNTFAKLLAEKMRETTRELYLEDIAKYMYTLESRIEKLEQNNDKA